MNYLRANIRADYDDGLTKNQALDDDNKRTALLGMLLAMKIIERYCLLME